VIFAAKEEEDQLDRTNVWRVAAYLRVRELRRKRAGTSSHVGQSVEEHESVLVCSGQEHESIL
jgi:hypothetical protein